MSIHKESYQRQLADLYKRQGLRSDKARSPTTYAELLADTQPTIDDDLDDEREDDLLAALSGKTYGSPARFMGGVGAPLPSASYAALSGRGGLVPTSNPYRRASARQRPVGDTLSISYSAPDGTLIQMSAQYSGETKGQVVDTLFKAAYQVIMGYAGQEKRGGSGPYRDGGKAYSGSRSASYGKGGK